MNIRDINALVAEKVLGWTPWLELRGEYHFIVWQKTGQREPWMGTREWQKAKERYSLFTGKYDPMVHIENGLPNFVDDMNWTAEVIKKLGLALIPQSDGDGFCWLATDVKAVHYDGNVVIEEKEDAGYAHKEIGVAVCMAGLLSVGVDIKGLED